MVQARRKFFKITITFQKANFYSYAMAQQWLPESQPESARHSLGTTKCQHCQNILAEASENWSCSCQLKMHWKCFEDKIRKDLEYSRYPSPIKGLNHFEYKCQDCDERYWVIAHCQDCLLKMGSLSDAVFRRTKQFVWIVLLVLVCCTGYIIGTYFLFNLFWKINGLLLLWVIFGMTLALFCSQQFLSLILQDGRANLKIIKVLEKKQLQS